MKGSPMYDNSATVLLYWFGANESVDHFECKNDRAKMTITTHSPEFVTHRSADQI
jgi:hypothetical protein